MKKNTLSPSKKEIWLVSSCLVGLKTRYDGQLQPSQSCLHFLSDKQWLPVCPEQLGGLATPRVPAQILNGNGHDVLSETAQVVTGGGVDLSAEFVLGAQQVLQLLSMQNVVGMCVKARSPSCGLHEIVGVTSALLLENGLFLKEF